MDNREIANIFREVAKILELNGDNPFRIRAYERGAQSIEGLGGELEVLVKEDKLTSIPGIGVDLAKKIKEMTATGKLRFYDELKKKTPQGLLAILNIPGLGPKTVKLIYEELKIKDIAKLEEAARQGRLKAVEGIKEKTEENILRGIQLLKKGQEATPLYLALRIARGFTGHLKKMKEVAEVRLAGSLRRRKEAVKDIDILAISKEPEQVIKRFVSLPEVKEVLAKGETKSSVIAKENNLQADLRVLSRESFGSALLYFTGSKEFNIKLRQLAGKDGYKINEYGVFSLKKNKEKRAAGRSEEEIFSLMKMAYIPPELREDRGEVEAALLDRLPKIIERKDIRGDLHVHSRYSDGEATIAELAKRCEAYGYDYLGLSDHSQSLKVAGGLSSKEVYKKIDEIRKVNKKSRVRLLCGTEVDISGEGKLDYPGSILKEFDLVIAAIHSGFRQSKEQLTGRIVSACKNKYVRIIAHPTGRLWGIREPYAFDFDTVFKACLDYNVALEVNCFPQRSDLNDLDSLKAKRRGVKLSLGTDAHSLEQLSAMELGVSLARRGWLEKKDIINCLSLDKLLKWLKR